MPPIDLKVLARRTDSALRRRLITQELLGREIDQIRVGFEFGKLGRELMQPPQRHGDGAARRSAHPPSPSCCR